MRLSKSFYYIVESMEKMRLNVPLLSMIHITRVLRLGLQAKTTNWLLRIYFVICKLEWGQVGGACRRRLVKVCGKDVIENFLGLMASKQSKKWLCYIANFTPEAISSIMTIVKMAKIFHLGVSFTLHFHKKITEFSVVFLQNGILILS